MMQAPPLAFCSSTPPETLGTDHVGGFCLCIYPLAIHSDVAIVVIDIEGDNRMMGSDKKRARDRDRMQAKRKKIDDFIEFVRSAPVASGVCCCGDNIDGHADPMSCGHSPVDQWDRSLSLWLEELGK